MSPTESERRLQLLESTVAALADELAISRLIASYGPLVGSATDQARCREVAELWTEEGVYDLGPDAVATGHTQIAALFMHPIHQKLIREGGAHVMGLPRITLDGDRATVISCSRVYRAGESEPAGSADAAAHPPATPTFHVWRVAANRWELVRTPTPDGSPSQWRIARRINRLLNDSAEARELMRF